MFSKIELTDDDSLLDDRTSNDIGQIVLEVVHGKYTLNEQVVGSQNVIDRTLRLQEGKVHERSKKACSHHVAFGEEVSHHEPALTFTVIRDNTPKTIFVFKYTRLDVLQAMGVAPHTPISAETETETEDRDDENEVMDMSNESSPSDDVKPLARIRELEMELQRLREQVEDRKPSRVKLEHGGSRRKQAATEVIDLTED